MPHLDPDILKFLGQLKKNNSRDWFEDNKPRYKAAQENLIDFVDKSLNELIKFDKSLIGVEPKKCVFRIYRDVRFSKNKDPYKTNLGAHIAGGSKMQPRAGYYLHIEPGACMIAGGAYLPPAPWLKAIRQEIHHNADELKKILKSASYKKHFGSMEGEQLKTAPRDYPKDHPEIELLRYKSFLSTHLLKDKQVSKKDFGGHFLKVAKALYPFDAYLNMAMD